MSPPDLIPTIASVLAEGRQARIRVTGGSMHPTIRSGETIILERPTKDIEAGEIVLYEAARGLTAHRVIGIEPEHLLVRGDGSLDRHVETVSADKVLALVVAVERDSKPRTVIGSLAKRRDLVLASVSRWRRRLVPAGRSPERPARPLESDAGEGRSGERPSVSNREFGRFFRSLIQHDNTTWPLRWNDSSDSFLRLASEHGVAPLVHWYGSKTSGYEAWPLRVREALRRTSIEKTATDAWRWYEVRRVLAALTADECSPILLKGAALAHLIYPESYLRPMSDVDVFIDHGQLDQLRDAMTRLGYDERASVGNDAHAQTIFIRHEGRSRHVWDVHWALSNAPALRDLMTWHQARERSSCVRELGEGARAMSFIDLLLHACIHRVGHHHSSERLLWLLDIHLLVNRLDDEELRAFWTLAAARGVRQICSASIQTAAQWLGESVPDDPSHEFLPETLLDQEEASSVLLRPAASRLGRLASEVRTTHGPVARLRWLRLQLFPSSRYMLAKYGRQSQWLLPWLYARRAWSALGRLAQTPAATDPLGTISTD